nr:DUF2850 domain-containing protein [Vibrio sinus]
MYREKFSDKDSIYGTWVEQEVAPYMADKIVLGKKGVMKNGSLVATHFSFDGEIFEYTSGGVPMRFIMLNNKLSKMKFLTKHPYQPVYKLSGN